MVIRNFSKSFIEKRERIKIDLYIHSSRPQTMESNKINRLKKLDRNKEDLVGLTVKKFEGNNFPDITNNRVRLYFESE